MKPITYISEQHIDWRDGLSAVDSVTALRALAESYGDLATDAAAVAAAMTDEDWPDFQRGLLKERRGHYAGDAWAKRYAAVLLPEPMLMVSILASHYRVPFGLAYMRLTMWRWPMT